MYTLSHVSKFGYHTFNHTCPRYPKVVVPTRNACRTPWRRYCRNARWIRTAACCRSSKTCMACLRSGWWSATDSARALGEKHMEKKHDMWTVDVLRHEETTPPLNGGTQPRCICTRTLRNLVRNLVLKLHRIAPELIWAKDPIAKFCCEGIKKEEIMTS